jgi:hypothetical protein
VEVLPQIDLVVARAPDGAGQPDRPTAQEDGAEAGRIALYRDLHDEVGIREVARRSRQRMVLDLNCDGHAIQERRILDRQAIEGACDSRLGRR